MIKLVEVPAIDGKSSELLMIGGSSRIEAEKFEVFGWILRGRNDEGGIGRSADQSGSIALKAAVREVVLKEDAELHWGDWSAS